MEFIIETKFERNDHKRGDEDENKLLPWWENEDWKNLQKVSVSTLVTIVLIKKSEFFQ